MSSDCKCKGWLVGWLVGWLFGWLVAWLVAWMKVLDNNCTDLKSNAISDMEPMQ